MSLASVDHQRSSRVTLSTINSVDHQLISDDLDADDDELQGPSCFQRHKCWCVAVVLSIFSICLGAVVGIVVINKIVALPSDQEARPDQVHQEAPPDQIHQEAPPDQVHQEAPPDQVQGQVHRSRPPDPEPDGCPNPKLNLLMHTDIFQHPWDWAPREARASVVEACVSFFSLKDHVQAGPHDGCSWSDVSAVNEVIRKLNIFKIAFDAREESFEEMATQKTNYDVPMMGQGLTREKLALVLHKDKFNAFVARELNMPSLVPRAFEGPFGIAPFPKNGVMVKPAAFGRGERKDLYQRLRSQKEVDDFVQLHPDDVVSFGEYIPAEVEDTLYFVFDSDRFLRHKLGRRRNAGIVHHTGDHPTFLSVEGNMPAETLTGLRAILTTLRYRGIGCIDLVYADGEQLKQPKVLELNPRVCANMMHFKDFGAWIRDWALLSG